jgi:hypothetical protein
MEPGDEYNIQLNVDDVLRGEGVDPEVVRLRKPPLLRAAEKALEEGCQKVHPAVIIHEADVVEHRHERIILHGGFELGGSLVAHHLAGAEQVTSVVCTIGSELEDHASRIFANNPLLGISLDGLANAAVEILSQQVCSRLGEKAQTNGLTTSTPLSPGEPGWPVEVGQPQIFALADPSNIGIKLTSGGMMLPKKSISFVVGIGKEMAQTDLCEICSLRERCRYRHA